METEIFISLDFHTPTHTELEADLFCFYRFCETIGSQSESRLQVQAKLHQRNPDENKLVLFFFF